MKHRYLKDIDITSYPDNNYGGFNSIKDWVRHIKYKLTKHKTGVDPRECWNLDEWYYQWLYERLKQYKYDAGKIVDLEYQKFKYKRREYTQLELINLLCDLLTQMIQWDEFEDVDMDKPLEFIKNDDGTYQLKDSISEEEAKKIRETCRNNRKEKQMLKTEIFNVWKILIDSMWW